MTKRIFRSVFFAALVVMLAAVGLMLAVLYNYFTQVQRQQLRAETALVAHAVSNEGMAYFETLDASLECRITWIGADGRVLYDNRTDSMAMENHMQRQEVSDAFQNGYGESTRYSDTLVGYHIYAAQLLQDGTVLRLSASQDSIVSLMLGIAKPMALVVTVALALSLLLASRLSRSIVEPLNDLDLKAPLRTIRYEEIRPLLQRLDYQQTRLREQARELSRRQREFDEITRSLSEGLVLLAADKTILSINPAAARLLSVTPNCTGADFTVANQNPRIGALAEAAILGEKGEITVSVQGGDYLVAANPVRNAQSVTGAVLLLLDVTQKHQAEALRREFTANVSHELKTPLHTISGYAELIQQGLAGQQDIPAFAGKICEEARRMTRLVENMLQLSRLDEGGRDMVWSSTDLYSLAEQTLQTLQSTAELAGVKLTLEGNPTTVFGIRQLLSGIIFNLVDNAIKYSHAGGVVTVFIDQSAQGPRLTVTDNGIGIPLQEQERIFERFYCVDKSHSRAVGGTGLGLSIVKHAARIHNARISLESSPSTGTEITVQFPAAEQPSEA